MTASQTSELRDRFDYWHHPFPDLGISANSPALADRAMQRLKRIVEPLLEIFPSGLEGKNVLDLGCNSGFWTLQLLEAGCEHVIGVDSDLTNVRQAKDVLRASGISSSRRCPYSS